MNMTMKVALLTGGGDKPYSLGIAKALLDSGIKIEFIGNSELENEKIFLNESATYYNLRGDQSSEASIISKIFRVILYYFRLIKYAANTDTKLFHILWLNKFLVFDSTLLNIFYKLNGKKLVYTAHNVNIDKRDGNDSILNRRTLKFLYNYVDHIFVHTKLMKDELTGQFGTPDAKVTVIPFGINSTVPNTELNYRNARNLLNLSKGDIALLFFGNIATYKGLETLIDALKQLVEEGHNVKLIIAGSIKGTGKYWECINSKISSYNLGNKIIKRIEFIPDEEVEVYFKAADALMLPYKFIYQSGPLFLAYNFGLPAIATDVGSFKDDIVEGKTGFVSLKNDGKGFADAITRFIYSSLYKEREISRQFIRTYAAKRYSWNSVAEKTVKIYEGI